MIKAVMGCVPQVEPNISILLVANSDDLPGSLDFNKVSKGYGLKGVRHSYPGLLKQHTERDRTAVRRIDLAVKIQQPLRRHMLRRDKLVRVRGQRQQFRNILSVAH